jgi:quinol monooxygenase YgiN
MRGEAVTAHNGAGVIRIATLTAQGSRMPALLHAARTNAEEARSQPGCLSAEVGTVPDDDTQLVVVSRWRSADDLTAFLSWHEGIAHELIRRASSVAPRAMHYPIER